MDVIGFGGGCHWCTEAVFQSLIGVDKVSQGWINSIRPYDDFSEAVLVNFQPDIIDLKTLLAVHLYTHSATSQHSLRNKYRSAAYYFSEKSKEEAIALLSEFQKEFKGKLITKILPFQSFKPNKPAYINYYTKQPEKPFCKTYIEPKLLLIQQKFKKNIRHEK
ncbi:peptide-methionine (S)-S-oxide reductase [Membranihabitans marinus]|uniref:peptide-methionine (S)-S-oxide reductase n=1 Tax=Membranihabitans marinus TaxID=1227546 RepID=UPI001F349922|nr:peptide-methionine (S)-S-oxide reductase [Membranihabitans marinus]